MFKLTITVDQLASHLEVGDVVFIRIRVSLFEKIASTTQSWTNHVGIVIAHSGPEPVIAESRLPWSGTTSLRRFVARSEAGRVAISRPRAPLTAQQRGAVRHAARRRSGVLYDTGFDLHSHRQFCSRFVREVLADATGVEVGEIEDFSTLFARHPNADLRFWRLWYFGNIPWQRQTVTPASLLRCPHLYPLFDGHVTTRRPLAAR